MEKTPELPTEPMTLDEIRAVLQQNVDAIETEVDLLEYQQQLSDLQEEIADMFTKNLLEQSQSWHVLKGSGLPDGAERLPDEVESKVVLVITDMLRRRF